MLPAWFRDVALEDAYCADAAKKKSNTSAFWPQQA
jgi:hypothetical protein